MVLGDKGLGFTYELSAEGCVYEMHTVLGNKGLRCGY